MTKRELERCVVILTELLRGAQLKYMEGVNQNQEKASKDFNELWNLTHKDNGKK